MQKINKFMSNVLAVNDGGSSYTLNSQYTDTVSDTEKLEQLVSDLRAKHTALETNVSALYLTIDNMPNTGAWDGVVYGEFKDKAYSYKDGIEGFVLMINAYADIIQKVIDYTNTNLSSSISKHSGGGK